MSIFSKLLLAFFSTLIILLIIAEFLLSIFLGNNQRDQFISQLTRISQVQVATLADFNGEGQMIDLNQQRVKQLEFAFNKDELNFAAFDQNDQPIGENTYFSDKAKKKLSQKNLVFSDYNGDSAVSYIRVESDNKKIGTLRLSGKYDANQASLRAVILSQLAISGVIGLIAAMFIAYFLARNFSNRITNINRAANKISSGDYGIKIGDQNEDEIGNLSTDINKLAQSLNQQQNELKRQENLRNQLLGNASHEMRTPLTTISGILEGLMAGVIDKKADQQKSYKLMKSESDRLLRLVEDNLSFERVRSKKTVLKIEEINVLEQLEMIISQLKLKAETKGDQFVFNVKKNVNVSADRDNFTQIFFNIINNAIQFTENGQIEISATQDKKSTTIKVTDTGIGMSEEQVEHIFDRFYKADQARAKTEAETGLGMSIVKEIVNRHDGKININSQSGEGTEVEIIFKKQ